MRHDVRRLVMLLLAAAPLASAADVRPGDQVRLVERDQHIPALPAPGDSRVSLRLVSGSQATVLQVNAATGWLEVQGEPVQGTSNTGWITPSYLAGVPGTGEPTTDSLACVSPPKARLRRIPVADCGSPPGTWRTSMRRMGSRPISRLTPR
jgi:hypothetical protein